MNNMPVDWINQIKAEYPARSGGLGWLDMRLMLAVRRALLTHTWEQITDAIKAYKAAMPKSGDIKLSKILSQLRKRDKVMLSTVEQMRLALESVLLVMHSNQERLLKLESEWLKCTMPVSPHLPQSVN